MRASAKRDGDGGGSRAPDRRVMMVSGRPRPDGVCRSGGAGVAHRADPARPAFAVAHELAAAHANVAAHLAHLAAFTAAPPFAREIPEAQMREVEEMAARCFG